MGVVEQQIIVVVSPFYKVRRYVEQSLYYLGSGAVGVSPFLINSIEGRIVAIAGLLVLTIQVARARQYNLVVLNLVGIVGYIFSILTGDWG